MNLQITTSKSAEEVIEYFTKTLELYFSRDGQEFLGDWGGKLAETFGLKGRFTAEAFERLLNNRHPFTDEQLTDRMRDDRRPGFDFTWGVPKSISLAYAKTKDERIIQKVRETIWEMMEKMQEHAAVRVRAGDKNRDEMRISGQIVWAEQIHLTARPVDGFSDPHVHVHMYVPNVSWDPEEKKFKALEIRRIKDMAANFQKMAAQRLREKMAELDLEMMPTETGYEIKGFSRDIIEKFSRRTMTIEATAERLGITDPKTKAQLGVMTREKKIEKASFSDFESFWWANPLPGEEAAFRDVQERLNRSRARELSQQFTKNPERAAEIEAQAAEMKASLGEKDKTWVLVNGKRRRFSMNAATRPRPAVDKEVIVTENDRKAVAMAHEHLLERQSAVRDLDLVAEASRHWYLGQTTLAGIWQAVAELPLIRREYEGWNYLISPEVLAEENMIVDYCRLGKEQYEALHPKWRICDTELNEEQRAAVNHVLNTKDFITGILGNPGVGKTRVLREIKAAVESRFEKFFVFAPWASTAHEVLRREGFENANTVAMLLANPKLQQEAKGAVWVVDEAGQLSTPDGLHLLALGAELNARIVLAGDVAQHLPVGRGQMFGLLKDSEEMEIVEIREIQRQKGENRRVVELLVEKRAVAAIDLMEKLGNVFEMPLEERRVALAKEYVSVIEKGETAVVVAPTHVERRDITGAIRDELKKKGLIRDAGEHRVMRKLSLPKDDPASYKPGMIVRMESPVKGFRMDEELRVVSVREDMVKVRGLYPHETKTKMLPLAFPEAFEVYEVSVENRGKWEILQNLHLTLPEKSDPGHFKIGQVVQITAHMEGFALGEALEVVGVREEMVRVRSVTGHDKRTKPLPLDRPGAFTVNERDTIEICEGEWIRATANGRTADRHRLYNGTSYKVDYIAPDGNLVLANGWRLDRRFKNIEFEYTETSHGVQGSTVDHVFLAQSPELSAGASDLRQFLVSISRGKDAKLYTTDLESLKDCVCEERVSLMATHVLQDRPTARGLERDIGLNDLEMQEAEMLRDAAEIEYDSSEPAGKYDKASKFLGTKQEMMATVEVVPREIQKEEEIELEMEM